VKKLLTPVDLISIRKALTEWGKPKDLIDRYGDVLLSKQVEVWEKFVQMEWTSADRGKYVQDIAVRYWLQLVIEHATKETAAKLSEIISPFDERFKEDMRDQETENYVTNLILTHRPYFWENHTLVSKQPR